MAKRNRPSVLKRQREAEKRQRAARKAAKAALKRERRMNKGIAPVAEVRDLTEPLGLPAELTGDRNDSDPSSGASGTETPVPETG